MRQNSKMNRLNSGSLTLVFPFLKVTVFRFDFPYWYLSYKLILKDKSFSIVAVTSILKFIKIMFYVDRL